MFWMLRAAGSSVMRLALQHVLPHRALHVDDGRLAGDGDRLLDAANPHVDVHRRGEAARRQLDPVAHHGGEARAG